MEIDFKAAQKAVREKRERDCFGCSIEDLRNGVGGLFSWKSPESLILLSASIQSDCQELLDRDADSNQIRQYLNRSKYVLSEASRLIRLEEAK